MIASTIIWPGSTCKNLKKRIEHYGKTKCPYKWRLYILKCLPLVERKN
jgi:hypothetical protein